ncbi:MAG: carboxypeptidase regulatory-like domain-containing protein [Gemmatimonadota bacterium]|nr:carboxypeptidase regulatory-like domain-containing protein [Gemmatimonadota bacterium]
MLKSPAFTDGSRGGSGARHLDLVRATLITLAAALSPAPRAHAQETKPSAVIDGTVSDTALRALANAIATIEGTGISVTTGESGRFRIVDLRPGEYIVGVRRLGYQPAWVVVAVAGADTVRLSFALEMLASQLDPVVVTSSPYPLLMEGFEERRRLGIGHFLNAAEIDAKHATFAADLIRSIPSVQVRTYNGTQQAVSLRQSTAAACPFEIFVNAFPLRSRLTSMTYHDRATSLEWRCTQAPQPCRFSSNAFREAPCAA